MSEIKDIPKHWEIRKLGEVCEIFAGGDVPKDNFSLTPSDKYQIPIYANGEKNKGLYGYTDIAKVITPSVTISARGTIGFALVRNKPFFPIVRLIVLNPNKTLDVSFLKYAIDNSKIKHTGSSIPQLTVPVVKTITILLPPLPEQQAIVAKIEELLSELDNGKQQLLTAQQQLKVYRQSLLKWAFEGKLTNGTKNWKSLKLKDASIKIVVGYVGPVAEHIVKSGGVKFLSTTHIGENEFLNHEIREVSNVFNEKNKKSQVIPGDILIARHGDSGKACIVPDIIQFAQVSNAVILRPNPEIISSKFICYRLNAERQRMQKMKVGGVFQVVNTKSMESFILSIPAIEEQQLIVSELESKLTVCDKIEETISQSLQQAETLRQSILKKAFEGRLVN